MCENGALNSSSDLRIMVFLVSRLLHSSRWNAVTIDYLTIKPTHLTTNPAVRANKYARLSGKVLLNNISTEIAHKCYATHAY